MAVELKIPTRKGLTLYTKKKFIEDDIDVTLDDSLIPKGTITITENGEYDVSNYETANVNTPVPTGTLEVTENGEHDVASYEKVNVAVAGSGGSQGYQFKGTTYGLQTRNLLFYSLDGGTTWLDIYEYHHASKSTMWLFNVSEIMIKICVSGSFGESWGIFHSDTLGMHIEGQYGERIETIKLTQNVLDVTLGQGVNTGGEA